MKNQFSLGNYQYPRQLTNATDILGNHHHDKPKKYTKHNNSNNNNNNNNNEAKPSETSFAQGNKKYAR